MPGAALATEDSEKGDLKNEWMDPRYVLPQLELERAFFR
jgi:hypothetical protein